jgi:hypothetical protein
MELAASPIPATPARFKNRLRGILATGLLLLLIMLSEGDAVRPVVSTLKVSGGTIRYSFLEHSLTVITFAPK